MKIGEFLKYCNSPKQLISIDKWQEDEDTGYFDYVTILECPLYELPTEYRDIKFNGFEVAFDYLIFYIK